MSQLKAGINANSDAEELPKTDKSSNKLSNKNEQKTLPSHQENDKAVASSSRRNTKRRPQAAREL